VRFEVTGTINNNEITIKPIIDASTKPTDFTQKTTMEGPLITEASIILAIITAAITLAEYLARRRE
jgi:hypothetical protein